MREWFAAAELAGVPGMPGSRQNVIARAKRDGWESRKRKGKGGGLEYRVASLPKEARAYLVHASVEPRARELMAADPAALPVVYREPQRNGALKDWQREVRDARLLVLDLVEQLTCSLGSTAQAIGHVLEMAGAGSLPAPYAGALDRANARRREGHALSRGTLYSWLQLRREQGADALAPNAAPERDRPRWLSPLLEAYQDPLAKPTVAECLRRLQRAGIEPPPLRTAQQHIRDLPAVVREFGRMGTRARRSIKPFVRRSTDGLWPMDVVAVDGHALKSYVAHPMSGEPFGPEVTTYIDIATRFIPGWSAWVAESQYGIWLALRSVVLNERCGIMAVQYSDNGAYKGEEHLALLARLGITPVNSRAYNPQANGAVERVNQTVWRDVAHALFPKGRQVDKEAFERARNRLKTVGDNLPSWEQFLEVARARISEYNATPHERLRRGRERLSPARAWEIAVDEGWRPTLLEGDALHDLLPSEERICRRAEVVVQGRIYFSQDLVNYHGQTVRVSSDPADGQRVWVSDTDGRLICEAIRNGNTRHYLAEDRISHAQEKRRQAAVQRKQSILDQIERRETPLLEGTPSTLPDLVLHPPGALLSTPARPLTESAGAEIIQLRPAAPAPAPVEPLPFQPIDRIDRLDNDAARYEAWREIRTRLDAGHPVSERERAFFTAFGRSSYCQGAEKLWADWEAQFPQPG